MDTRDTKRYMLTLMKVPYEARDEFRRLSRPGTYMEVKRGREGQRVTYAVEMTGEEYERALRVKADPTSNLIDIEPEQILRPDSVPGAEALEFMSASNLAGSLDGRGVAVVVIDSGIGAALASGVFSGRIKDSRSWASVRYEDGSSRLLDPLEDRYGHGSQMASVAVPRRSRIVVGRVLDDDGSGTQIEAAAALNWAVDEVGVGIASISLGFDDPSTGMRDAVSNAHAKNTLVFCSAGNDGIVKKQYPSGYPESLTITNYDCRSGEIASSSTYGVDVFVGAPGSGIRELEYTGEEIFDDDGGTSSATAHAAHVGASLMTQGRSAGNVRSYMARTARRTDSPRLQGNGIIQAAAAAQARANDRPYRRKLNGDYESRAGEPLSGKLVNRDTGEPLPEGPMYGARRPGRLVDPSGAELSTQPACEA